MLMKLCPSEQNIVATILKWPGHVTCKDAQLVHILGKLQFADQNLLARMQDHSLSWDPEIRSTWNFN